MNPGEKTDSGIREPEFTSVICHLSPSSKQSINTGILNFFLSHPKVFSAPPTNAYNGFTQLTDTLADSQFPGNNLCASMVPAFLSINYHSISVYPFICQTTLDV